MDGAAVIAADVPAADAPAEEAEIQTEVKAPQKRRHRATVKAVEVLKPPEPAELGGGGAQADPMFFPMLLRTQRQLEKEARHVKISSLRIC
jgi:hypothetical protein